MQWFGKAWESEEVQILKDNRHLSADDLMKILPGRSKPSITSKRAKLGYLQENVKWSDEEVATLKRLAGTCSTTEAATHFPKRSPNAVTHKIKAMQLDFQKSEILVTGQALIDAVRVRSKEDGISLRSLDRELGTGRYFFDKSVRYARRGIKPNMSNISKAVDFFGGELVTAPNGATTINWKDV